jgi:hypothetical protein
VSEVPEMTEDRAANIVRAINQRCFVTMGVGDGALDSLEGVSLADMLAAVAKVRAANDDAEARQRAEGGSRSIFMLPDDRLTAAVYVMEHYQDNDSGENILQLPSRNFLGESGVSILTRVGVYGEDYRKAMAMAEREDG